MSMKCRRKENDGSRDRQNRQRKESRRMEQQKKEKAAKKKTEYIDNQDDKAYLTEDTEKRIKGI